MDPSRTVRHPASGYRKRGGLRAEKLPPTNPQLFDDTSTQSPLAYSPPPPHVPGNDQNVGAPQPTPYDPTGMTYPQQPAYDTQPGMSFPGQPQFMADPVANIAMQYGQTLAGQGKEYVNKNLEKYVSAAKLKHYFAVDTSYVGRKIRLLLFPFVHKDWTMKYNQDEPLTPRYDINAPDLYIPVMAFVTYILLAGVMLGKQKRFSPEQLGMTASTALVWLIIEIVVLLLSMYIMNVSTDLKYYDFLAYCGYKYVGIILVIIGGLLFQSTGYYVLLLWTSLCIAFYLFRALKFAIIPHTDPDGYARGNKRRLYMLLLMSLSQPLFIWWLTFHLMA